MLHVCSVLYIARGGLRPWGLIRVGHAGPPTERGARRPHVNVRRNYRWSVGAVTGVGEGQEGVRRRAELSVPFNMLNMEGVWRACRGLLR